MPACAVFSRHVQPGTSDPNWIYAIPKDHQGFGGSTELAEFPELTRTVAKMGETNQEADFSVGEDDPFSSGKRISPAFGFKRLNESTFDLVCYSDACLRRVNIG